MNHVPTIAIVDDDEGVRASLSSLVRSLGYHVRAYASAPAFLATLGEGDPDCLVSDIQMSPMTGEALQAALIESGRHFPMIFMTAFSTDAIRTRVLASGARAWLEKPVDGDLMARSLADALG